MNIVSVKVEATTESAFLIVIEFLPALPSNEDRLFITGVLTWKREFFIWFASWWLDKKLLVTVTFWVLFKSSVTCLLTLLRLSSAGVWKLDCFVRTLRKFYNLLGV